VAPSSIPLLWALQTLTLAMPESGIVLESEARNVVGEFYMFGDISVPSETLQEKKFG